MVCVREPVLELVVLRTAAAEAGAEQMPSDVLGLTS